LQNPKGAAPNRPFFVGGLMEITTIIGSAIGLGTEVFKYLNTKQSRKYLDKLVKLQLDIKKEEDKGYQSDDLKLEKLYGELGIILNGARNEISIAIKS